VALQGSTHYQHASRLEKARLSRDPRFDGHFFIGVKTTGIYCRPVCPVKLPKAENVTFFKSAAAAASQGFRPCLRCRPEASPGTPAWSGTSATVSRAMRLISEGALDGDDIDALAARLGIGPRHLCRLFDRHLGAPPLAVAQTRRLHFAKRLVDDTTLKMSDIALASGYNSVRRFNAHFKAVYDRSPSHMRSRKKAAVDTIAGFSFKLHYRPPYDWEHVLGFLGLRAVPGVEIVVDNTYVRNIVLGGEPGVIRVGHLPAENCLISNIEINDPARLLIIVERIKKIFDLTADPQQISRGLAASDQSDGILQRLIELYPGTRIPGCWDSFEIAVRAIVGQQVSVAGATTVMGRLVQQYGSTVNGDVDNASRPGYLFPGAEQLACLDVSALSMPRSRAGAIKAMARAVVAGDIDFTDDAESLIGALKSIKGIGDWTAQYVAMRACGAPDAFLAGDLVLQKVVAREMARNRNRTKNSSVKEDYRLSHRELEQTAEQWRPWRAYAAMLLWRCAG
jgi:AraC family transcriptional regulator of adaptative response / DNA-3-methyladenine glycosylase II